MKTKMAFAMYKPKEGKSDELAKIIDQHVSTLREYGMVSDRNNYRGQSKAGVIIEVFEWKSDEAIKAVHEHPAVAALWEKMYAVCTFEKMRDLPESDMIFPNFELIE